jgi:hypothetical protein
VSSIDITEKDVQTSSFQCRFLDADFSTRISTRISVAFAFVYEHPKMDQKHVRSLRRFIGDDSP